MNVEKALGLTYVDEKELARLRRIEEAARRVTKDMGPTNMNALRAALEEEV